MHELMHDQDLTTVVMLIPPHEVQALAVPILRKYAPDTLTRVPAHLTVLVETFYHGESLATVARQLGIPAGTARSRLHYALHALGQELQEDDPIAS